MNHTPQTRARLKWIIMYLENNDAGATCLKCGISRPTLRKWVKRFLDEGEIGLFDLSKKPLRSPKRKVFQREEEFILELRKKRNLGARRIQHELLRLHELHLSLDTIHKVLKKNSVKPLKKVPRKKQFNRYSKSLPGERLQLDTCKIAPGIYQYTAIDDFSRFLVAEIYPRRTANNTLDFLEHVEDSYAVPIQYIQTDRGLEFMAEKVQRYFIEQCIKYRPNRPGAPHLNGKVERVQKTMKDEFWATIDLARDNLSMELGAWVTYYNYQRVHGSLGKTPAEMYTSRIWDTPESWEVHRDYDFSKERIKVPNYSLDLKLKELHERKD